MKNNKGYERGRLRSRIHHGYNNHLFCATIKLLLQPYILCCLQNIFTATIILLIFILKFL